ncbi:hypothetical protein AVEN_177040-1 [Araneus ventricosus]|uniref:Uncharacterized protein n=1 Tax=Araneus ventricosus TaxID=182803 RepID=A0A4Y2CT05_ARAVE|nr:hypothetical protein AVEN_177040-1 [Araneus ventricosus]
MTDFWSQWLGIARPRLSPCIYGLIPKNKEPLRDIPYRSFPGILKVINRSIRTVNRTGTVSGILRIPYAENKLYSLPVKMLQASCIGCNCMVATVNFQPVPDLMIML